MTARSGRRHRASDDEVMVEHLDGSTSWAVPNRKHPAVYSDAIVEEFVGLLGSLDWPGSRVLDPFAGTGVKLDRIRERVRERRKCSTVGVELEREWVACAPFGHVLVGDSTDLPAKWTRRFGAAVTSCSYGNRMADSHNNRDACSCRRAKDARGEPYLVAADPTCKKCKGGGLSSRRSYTHDLGRKLTANNSGSMHYGPAYRALHRAVWAEVARTLQDEGLFLLNVKDFMKTPKKGVPAKRVRVSEWHRRTILNLGFVHVETVLIPLKGLTHGANRERIPNELVYVFRKAA